MVIHVVCFIPGSLANIKNVYHYNIIAGRKIQNTLPDFILSNFFAGGLSYYH